MSKFYATGGDFAHPMSANAHPHRNSNQNQLRVANMMTNNRGKITVNRNKAGGVKLDRQLNAHMMAPTEPETGMNASHDLSMSPQTRLSKTS